MTRRISVWKAIYDKEDDFNFSIVNALFRYQHSFAPPPCIHSWCFELEPIASTKDLLKRETCCHRVIAERSQQLMFYGR